MRPCCCRLCLPKPPAPPTERELLRRELDRLGIPHNLATPTKENA